MRITIQYPEVRKMLLESQIEVSGNETLEDVKRLVFNSFWSVFLKISPWSKIHGSTQDVTLRDNGVEVLSDVDLKKLTIVQASFAFRAHQ